MTFPVYLRVGQWQLHPHLLFEALAYTIGFQVYFWRRRRHGDVVASPVRWSIVAAAIVGAALGGRMLYWLEDPVMTAGRWRDLQYLMGGKTIVGAILGGIAGVEILKRRLGVVERTGDLFAVPLALGIAIGRVGCFLSGLGDQTFGTESSLPWAIDFGDGVRRHPVQLYESLLMLAFAWLLIRFERHPHRSGDVFRWFLVGYMSWRVAVDALKPEVHLIAGLSALQLVAAGTAIYYAYELIRRPATQASFRGDSNAVT